MADGKCHCGSDDYFDEWFGNVGVRHYVCGHKKPIKR
jgi:hypothetical protein